METFDAAQNSQVARQNLLHDQIQQMQTETQVAHRMLKDITSSASALQAAIETSSTQLAKMPTVSGVTSAILQWGWVVLGIMVLYQFSSRFAGYAAAAFGIDRHPGHCFHLT